MVHTLVQVGVVAALVIVASANVWWIRRGKMRGDELRAEDEQYDRDTGQRRHRLGAHRVLRRSRMNARMPYLTVTNGPGRGGRCQFRRGGTLSPCLT
jgi:hypothetical protein